MHQSSEISKIFAHSRTFALENEINYIDTSTILLSILQSDLPTSGIFSKEDKEFMISQFLKEIAAQGKHKHQRENVPLTIDAELIIKFAYKYGNEIGDDELEAHHILFAILSCNCAAAEIFKRRGWIFENFLQEINGLANMEIKVDMLEFPIETSIRKPLSWLAKKVFKVMKDHKFQDKLDQEAYRLFIFKQYKSCRELCNVILDISKENTFAYYFIFLSLYKEKRIHEAIEFYESRPINSTNILVTMAICYQYIGNVSKALALYELINKNTPIINNNWGFALLDVEQFDQAIYLFDQAIAQDPEFPYSYNNKGFALFKKGQIKEAKEIILHSLSLDKGNSYAYRNLALIYIHEKNKKEAIAFLEMAQFYKYRENYGDDIDKIIAAANAL